MTWYYFGDRVQVVFCLVCLFACNRSVKARPLPEDGGTVTQTGEPSHFQVDDKAAEIEVNANPAGVKVNAKPASLQVVAKPGTPAVPIFHPAIHLAQHYAPPPVVHHHPVMFYHGCHTFPYCHNWFYNGIKREKFPRPRKAEVNVRTHKSDIPRAHHHKKDVKTRKRQFISALPQLVQPSSLGALSGLNAYGAYGVGALPRYIPLSSILGAYSPQRSSQERLFSIPAQRTPQQSLQETGITRGLVPTVGYGQDSSEVLRSYQRLYSELNRLSSLYNAILRQRSPSNSAQGFGFGTAIGDSGASSFNSLGSGLAYIPSTLGASQYSGAMVGYGKAYIPSPLSQLYRTQSSLTQSNELLGASLGSQQSTFPYVALSPLLQRSPLVSRSKVPGESAKKSKKHSKDKPLKEKRKADEKRQTLLEPILPEEPSTVDDLLQGDVPQDYKRQFILTPALETLQQLQPLQSMVTQQSLQPQLRQLQLQQLEQEQPLASQSVGVQPVGMQSVAGFQPVNMQQLGISGAQQLGNVLPLETTPLRYLTSSLVTPMENLGSSSASRQSSGLLSRMISPMTSQLMSTSLSPSSLTSPLLSNGLTHPQNALGSIRSVSPEGLFQDRSAFRHPLRFGYPKFTRRLLRQPQFRRRLHNFREYDDLDGLQPEVLGREQISQQGTYTTERLPSSEGQTLINSPVGFGPITVEAKTAEGARAAEAAEEDKRHSINKPVARNHTSKPQQRSLI